MKTSLYLKEAYKIIEEKLSTGFFSRASTIEKVQYVEKNLQLYLPTSYKNFLINYGSGGVLGIEIYGITRDLDGKSVPNMIWVTQNARDKYDLPKQYIVIGASGFGPWYIIDTSVKNIEGENPVLMYGGGYVTEKIADSFGEFLYNELKTAMKNEEN